MKYAENIIRKFGGVRAAAAAIGCSPSTIHGWKDRGSIPDAKKQVVLDAAHRCGVVISRDDFWPHAVAVDSATNGRVARHDLRPDIFSVPERVPSGQAPEDAA